MENKRVAENIKKCIKNKYKTIKDCSIKNFNSKHYLNNLISEMRTKEKYPTVKRLQEIAEICDCDFIDFFK